MARITMTGGFQIMPEGEQVLKITKAEYDEDFGKAVFTLTNAIKPATRSSAISKL